MVTAERTDDNYNSVVESIAEELNYFAGASQEQLNNAGAEAYEISTRLHWNNLSDKYREAYTLAEKKVDERADLFKSKQSIEYTILGNGKLDKPDWKKIYVEAKIPKELIPLREMSMNLWWSWNYEAMDLFKMIDPGLWESYRNNPIALLEALSIDKIEAMKRDGQFMEKLHEVYSTFRNYMDQKKSRPSKSVAYFSHIVHTTHRVGALCKNKKRQVGF